jgi:DNA-binding Xre family transcriptional regulator
LYIKKGKMLKIKEGIERLKTEFNEDVKQIDLARELWEDSEEKTQRMNISRLSNGTVISVKIEHVHKLCKALKCDANYLFGIKKQ